MASQLPPPATAQMPAEQRNPVRSLFAFRGVKKSGPAATPPAVASSVADPEPHTSFTEAEVIAAVNMHKSFRLPSVVPDVEVTGLPNFDDVTAYGVGEGAQERLWTAEASRLVQEVAASARPEFRGSEALAVDSRRSYEMLAAMADRVWTAMNIVIHDAENMLAEQAQDKCSAEQLHQCRRTLDIIVDRGEDESEDHDSGAPKPSHQDIHGFIDFLSAVVARVVCASADGSFLHLNVIAQLAKLCTKLKVLTADLTRFAQVSIDNAVPDQKIPLPVQQDLRGRQDDGGLGFGLATAGETQQAAPAPSGAHGLDSLVERLLEEAGLGRPNEREMSTKKGSLRRLYFAQNSQFRTGLFQLFRVLLLSMRGTNTLTSTPTDCYEMSSMVYVAGFERFRALVYEEHFDKNFVGSSDPDEINYVRVVYHLLDKIIRGFADQDPTGTRTAAGANAQSKSSSDGYDDTAAPSERENANSQSVGTRVSWTYIPSKAGGSDILKPPRNVVLRSMSQVISVIVPLILTSPTAVLSLDKMVALLASTDSLLNRHGGAVKPREFGDYTAFCCLATDDYIRMQRARAPGAARSLSHSLIRRNNLLRGSAGLEIAHAPSFPLSPAAQRGDDDGDRALLERHRAELAAARKKMKSWVLEEKGVVVQCKVYVLSLTLVSLLIVAGGLAVGGAVGQRIAGVDPFNITTYCWVFAAFVLLVAKSVRVHDWPWNDFLHGRVMCKSVSELSSVTGIDPQFIIAKLLQDERQSILQTRGPFNTVFRRSSEDGFSIDRPIRMWTMLLSGLVMIEVERIGGRGLVCLDLREGTTYGLVNYHYVPSSKSETRFIHCPRLSDKSNQAPAGTQGRDRIRLTVGQIMWMRTLGVYGNKDAEFV